MQQVAKLPVVADVLENPSEQLAGQAGSLQVEGHAQLEVQVCVPPLPQDCVAPTAQTPSPLQEPQAPDTQLPVLESQVTVLLLLPQFPQVSLNAGLLEAGQVCPVHGPHSPQVQPLQLAVQLLV